jgi:Arc/MetJ family transcription regulator
MVTHMKTTIEIADALLERAKRTAARQHTTLRALVEDGLRHVLDEPRSSGQFRLRRASFRGNGLRPGVLDAGWDRIRSIIYEDRGDL